MKNVMRKAIQSLCGLGVALLLGASSAHAAGMASPFFSRWTVSDDNPVFTARGRTYKTIDIGVCGHDFCGVSVDDRGICGATLFRFLAEHADGKTTLQGHGRWGSEVKNVVIDWERNDNDSRHDDLDVYLGDGYDFGDRSGNMPRFHAHYRRAGTAQCFAR